MKIAKRITALLLVTVLIILMIPSTIATSSSNTATVLFTHDLHSHLLPSVDENGNSYGGYARLMHVINTYKAQYPDALLIDGGDFSMGSLFQTAFPTSAIELRIMGAMGYDATTLGNHEFDYLPTGLCSMLYAAIESGDPLPMILNGNYLPPVAGDPAYTQDSQSVQEAFDAYGVQKYTILERGGIHYVLFGLFGDDADACAPNSGMILEDPITSAQAIVDEAVAQCRELYNVDPVVICLSHSGTENGKGEDYTLAEKVSGIDLIISGHSHTTLETPLYVNGTYVVSAGNYSKNLGVAQLSIAQDGTVTMADYELIPINDTVPEDPTIAAMVEGYKQEVETTYLNAYNMSFDQVVTNNPYTFDTVGQVYATLHESTLGNVYSDAYKWAAEQATGAPVDIALTASGVVRESIPVGDVTVSDVFNAASLGVGTEGELVSVYIYGADLKNALEVDATLSDFMTSARLYYSGIEYTVNTNRMLLNKVVQAQLRLPDGSKVALEDDKLYRVVCGMYMGQMLGNIEQMSFGLIVITPRTADGTPIAVKDLAQHVVRDSNGTPVKEWYAIASYLDSMGGTMDAKYATTDGRKVIYSSWNPVDMLQNANTYTYVAIAVILVLFALIVLATVSIIRKVKKAQEKRHD